MNLSRVFRKLRALGSEDPTSLFAPLLAPPRLHYDVEKAALNGISFKSGVRDLRPLGPASEYHLAHGGASVQYDAYGLVIDLDEEGVLSFAIALAHGQRFLLGPVAPCHELAVSVAGQTKTLTADTSAEMLDELLGTAYDRFTYSAGGLCSQYAIEGSHIIAEHDAAGMRLLTIDISESASSAQAGGA